MRMSFFLYSSFKLWVHGRVAHLALLRLNFATSHEVPKVWTSCSSLALPKVSGAEKVDDCDGGDDDIDEDSVYNYEDDDGDDPTMIISSIQCT